MVDEHAVAGADTGGEVAQAAIAEPMGGDEREGGGQESFTRGLYHVVQIVYHTVHRFRGAVMRYQVSTTIDAPLALVWTQLVDVEQWPRWTTSVDSVHRLDHGPFHLGSRARVQQPKLPTIVWTVTDFQPPRQFTWSVNSPGVTTHGVHVLAPGPDHTTIATLSIRRTGPLAWLVDKVTEKLTLDYMTLEAAGLKRASENARLSDPAYPEEDLPSPTVAAKIAPEAAVA